MQQILNENDFCLDEIATTSSFVSGMISNIRFRLGDFAVEIRGLSVGQPKLKKNFSQSDTT